MSEFNKESLPVSAYQQLSGILNALKSEEITINDAMNKIQLKDSKPSRPYCKVTSGGALALYGVTKQPIVLYADQWNKLIKIIKNNYVENYMQHNESRLKFKPKINRELSSEKNDNRLYERKNNFKNKYNKDNKYNKENKDCINEESIIDSELVEDI
jgi:hypothetical protein